MTIPDLADLHALGAAQQPAWPDRDAVEVWMHEDVPVYGILRWQRAGHKYECTSWRPKS